MSAKRETKKYSTFFFSFFFISIFIRYSVTETEALCRHVKSRVKRESGKERGFNVCLFRSVQTETKPYVESLQTLQIR